MYLKVVPNIVSRKMMNDTLELSPFKTCPKSILLVTTHCDDLGSERRQECGKKFVGSCGGGGQKPKAIECNITGARCPFVDSHRYDRSRRTKQHPDNHIKRRKTKRNKLWKAA